MFLVFMYFCCNIRNLTLQENNKNLTVIVFFNGDDVNIYSAKVFLQSNSAQHHQHVDISGNKTIVM